MNLRLWEKKDNAQILKIEQASFSDPWSEYMFDGFLSSPLNLGYVAEEDGEIVGYIALGFNTFEVEIFNIAVSEKYRRQGVGESLLKKAEEFALEKGAVALLLEVRESNVSARALYEKFGFLEDGKRFAYYYDGENAVLMSKEMEKK